MCGEEVKAWYSIGKILSRERAREFIHKDSAEWQQHWNGSYLTWKVFQQTEVTTCLNTVFTLPCLYALLIKRQSNDLLCLNVQYANSLCWKAGCLQCITMCINFFFIRCCWATVPGTGDWIIKIAKTDGLPGLYRDWVVQNRESLHTRLSVLDVMTPLR